MNNQEQRIRRGLMKFIEDFKSQPQVMKDLCWIYASVIILRDDTQADLLDEDDIEDTAETLETYFPYWELILLGMLRGFNETPEELDMMECNQAIEKLKDYKGLWGRDLLDADESAWEDATAAMI